MKNFAPGAEKIGAGPEFKVILCGCILVNALLRLYLLYRIIRFDVLAFVKNSYLKVFVVMLLLIPLFVLHSGWEIHNLGEFFCELLVCEIYLLMVIYGVGLNSKEKLIVRSKIFQICRIKY